MIDLNTLNSFQKKAVTTVQGPLLVLAGAGSGKTRVLTYRIAYMVEQCRINPYNILALTFTNKAAKEMRERLCALLGDCVRDMWVSTFHATCAKILRFDGGAIGIESGFTIYDDAERKAIIKPIMQRLNIDEKQIAVSFILHAISDAKNHSLDPISFFATEYGEYAEKLIKLYRAYEQGMRTANALDFDDLILLTIKLFTSCHEKLLKYRNKFRYVLVDEYQDTNMPQYELIRLLCEEHGNLCVVGDDDQSIYAWRGADIRNILEFEQDFKNATVVRLEQNYRSTGNILDAANAVISNNKNRKGKQLFTTSGNGAKITNYLAFDERDEAGYICKTINSHVSNGAEYRDFAILYRTNAQSRIIESTLLNYGIRYKVFGGFKFYERAEIKDIMSYLRLIVNPNDNAAFKRIINVPARSIGEKSIETLEEAAYSHESSMMNFMLNPMLFLSLPGALQKKLDPFLQLYKELCELRKAESAADLTDYIIHKIGYYEYLHSLGGEYESRVENLEELISAITEIEDSLEDGEDGLCVFLENAALATDMDESGQSDNYVSVMTIHSAKGLEYNTVFLAGAEEELFPTVRSLEDPAKLEEERRLCYVAITRARKKLYIINAQSRRLYNRTEYHRPSRFLEEIPTSLLEHEGKSGYSDSEYYTQSSKYKYKDFNSDFSSANKRAVGNTFSTGRATVQFTPATSAASVQRAASAHNMAKDAEKLEVGKRVKHSSFGEGLITQKTGSGKAAVVTVEFDSGEVKKLSAGFAPLSIIE